MLAGQIVLGFEGGDARSAPDEQHAHASFLLVRLFVTTCAHQVRVSCVYVVGVYSSIAASCKKTEKASTLLHRQISWCGFVVFCYTDATMVQLASLSPRYPRATAA